MNIAEILKDCPKDTRLYSPLFGYVLFEKIVKTEKHPIYVRTCLGNVEETFTNSGLFCYNYPGECMLFPSKENRDWSTFKVPKKEYEFKPFDKVLVRDNDSATWNIDLFSYIVSNSAYKYKYSCLSADWKQCIPYEGNEHLVGTSKCV